MGSEFAYKSKQRVPEVYLPGGVVVLGTFEGARRRKAALQQSIQLRLSSF